MTDYYDPTTYTEAKRFVRASRSPAARTVYLTSAALPRRQRITDPGWHPVPCVGSPDPERPLTVYVLGTPFNVIAERGHVHIIAGAPYGSLITVEAAAAATTRITVRPGRKVTLEGVAPAVIDGDTTRLRNHTARPVVR